MVGVITKAEALSLAQAGNVDLVCISPDADPPVCRLVEYSKFRYEQARARDSAAAASSSRLGPLCRRLSRASLCQAELRRGSPFNRVMSDPPLMIDAGEEG